MDSGLSRLCDPVSGLRSATESLPCLTVPFPLWGSSTLKEVVLHYSMVVPRLCAVPTSLHNPFLPSVLLRAWLLTSTLLFSWSLFHLRSAGAVRATLFARGLWLRSLRNQSPGNTCGAFCRNLALSSVHVVFKPLPSLLSSVRPLRPLMMLSCLMHLTSPRPVRCVGGC